MGPAMTHESSKPGKCRTAVMRVPGDGMLSRHDLNGLAHDLEVAARDDAIGAVFLQGATTEFCSGLDITEFADSAGLESLAAALCRCFLAFAQLAKPLVVSVDGLACGFGATLLCHADVVVASDRSRIRMPFLDLGLLPEAGSTLLLAERIGHLNAFRLLCLGEEIDAHEACRIGLVSKVEPSDAVELYASHVARCLSRRPPDLLAATSSLMRRGRPDVIERIHLEVTMCLERLRDPIVRRRLARIAGSSQPRQNAA
jgi:enoyl-CoA hydratase/carnithine racemase